MQCRVIRADPSGNITLFVLDPVAAAVAQSEGLADGEFIRAYEQPAGSIMATVVRRKGEVTAVCIGGTVRFDEIETVEI